MWGGGVMANFSITGDQETLKLFKEVTEVEVKKALNKIGDINNSVPLKVWLPVLGVFFINSLASPKSATLTTPPGQIKIFWGLMSLWETFSTWSSEKVLRSIFIAAEHRISHG